MRILTAALLLASCPAMAQNTPPPRCSITMAEARSRAPELNSLSEYAFMQAIQRHYYPHLELEQVASALCVTLTPPFVPRDLSKIDQWRYDSCRKDAAQAPTSQGVNIGMRLCNEKFGQ